MSVGKARPQIIGCFPTADKLLAFFPFMTSFPTHDIFFPHIERSLPEVLAPVPSYIGHDPPNGNMVDEK